MSWLLNYGPLLTSLLTGLGAVGWLMYVTWKDNREEARLREQAGDKTPGSNPKAPAGTQECGGFSPVSDPHAPA